MPSCAEGEVPDGWFLRRSCRCARNGNGGVFPYDGRFDMSERNVRRYSRSRYGSGDGFGTASGGGRRRAVEDGAALSRIREADDGTMAPASRRRMANDGAADTRPRRWEAGDDEAIASRRRTADGEAADVASRRRAADGEMVAAAARRRKRKRVAAVVGGIVAAVVLVGAGLAFAFVGGIANNLNRGVDQDLRNVLVSTDMAREPFYMVLLGTDGSAVRDDDPEFAGGQYRSDSMMLARIDAPNKLVTLISIGRDIVVDLGEYGEQKINAAYALGGPALAVEAVSNLAGVPISHYAQVDFDGFQAMVDALGGIEVDVPMDIDDVDAGGSLSAGMQTLDGEAALVLSRARNAYADVAAHPDEMRAANQRLVLSAIAKKLLASDVATIAGTVQAMSVYVTTDLGLTDIVGLAQAMQGLDPDSSVYTAAVPTTSEYIDEGWYEFVDKAAWSTMMERVKAGMPPVEEAVVDEATGTVMATAGEGASLSAVSAKYATITVKNGTERSGLASAARSDLVAAGFANVVIGEVAEGYEYPKTLVIYDESGRAREAEEIVGVLGQGRAELNDGSYLLDGDFLVLIGDDWV